MYNGINITQTCNYIKILCESFIAKCCKKHLSLLVYLYPMAAACPTPFPCNQAWLTIFNAVTGNPDPKKQAELAKSMNLSYHSGFSEFIWAMTACCPDLAYVSIKLSHSNSCPHEHHYHGLCHALKYLYTTCGCGLYFWKTSPQT